MFIEGATKRAYTTMWCIYKRLACLSRSIGSFYKEEKTTNEKTSFDSPNSQSDFCSLWGSVGRSCAANNRHVFPRNEEEMTTTTKMVTQQSYFYEININWAKSASWVCQSTSKLVIKIIKAFFFPPSNRSVVHFVRCLWNFNEKVAFVGLPDKFGNATFTMVVGNVFVNNYQKYFLINAFLSIQLDSIRCDAMRSGLFHSISF